MSEYLFIFMIILFNNRISLSVRVLAGNRYHHGMGEDWRKINNQGTIKRVVSEEKHVG